MATETTDRLTSSVQVKYTNSKEIAENDTNKEVMAACVIQIANERNRKATELRDAGEVDEAKKLLRFNAEYLDANYRALGVAELDLRCRLNKEQSEKLDEEWVGNRKGMRALQSLDSTQQRYEGNGAKSDYGQKR